MLSSIHTHIHTHTHTHTHAQTYTQTRILEKHIAINNLWSVYKTLHYMNQQSAGSLLCPLQISTLARPVNVANADNKCCKADFWFSATGPRCFWVGMPFLQWSICFCFASPFAPDHLSTCHFLQVAKSVSSVESWLGDGKKRRFN